MEGLVERKFQYSGTGAGLFGNLFVGFLLCIVTLGIYTPWFIAKMYKYILENMTLNGGETQVRFDFRGSGAELFGIIIIGAILTGITLGIYYPWFMVNLTKYFAEHAVGRDGAGREYTGAFSGSGGKLFGIMFVGTLLTIITFGIYGAWFMCSMQKYFTENTTIKSDGQIVGTMNFSGGGGELLGTFILGAILTAITLGIYYPWFMVSLSKFFASHTVVTINGENHRMAFVGQGGKLFGICLVGIILSALTFGIYWFWFMTNMLKFGVDNTTFTTES